MYQFLIVRYILLLCSWKKKKLNRDRAENLETFSLFMECATVSVLAGDIQIIRNNEWSVWFQHSIVRMMFSRRFVRIIWGIWGGGEEEYSSVEIITIMEIYAIFRTANIVSDFIYCGLRNEFQLKLIHTTA